MPIGIDTFLKTPCQAVKMKLVKIKGKFVTLLSRFCNTFLINVIELSKKLVDLGFTYYNGKVTVLEENEEENHV
jgi:hypothetical protein